jgi:hypothetical protein
MLQNFGHKLKIIGFGSGLMVCWDYQNKGITYSDGLLNSTNFVADSN